MKNLAHAGVVAALITVVFVVVSSAQVPADFGFKFDYRPCLTNTLDTFLGTYSRQITLGEPPVAIPFTLTPEQMEELVQKGLGRLMVARLEAWPVPEPPTFIERFIDDVLREAA